MKTPHFSIIALGALGLLLCNCASTPQTRVEKNPDIFNRQTPQHQELIQRGEVAKGMTRAGVQLAWGTPSREVLGDDGKRQYEEWQYRRYVADYSRPRYSFGSVFGYSRGYRHHGHHGHHGRRHRGYTGFFPTFGIDFSPDYIPVVTRRVRFDRGLVTAWEKRQVVRR